MKDKKTYVIIGVTLAAHKKQISVFWGSLTGKFGKRIYLQSVLICVICGYTFIYGSI
jgi:hypothetical protein